MQPPPKKLLDQGRGAIRVRRYYYRTEETYVQWIRCYMMPRNTKSSGPLQHLDEFPREFGGCCGTGYACIDNTLFPFWEQSKDDRQEYGSKSGSCT